MRDEEETQAQLKRKVEEAQRQNAQLVRMLREAGVHVELANIST